MRRIYGSKKTYEDYRQVKIQLGNLKGDKRPKNQNKNHKTKILHAHGKNGPRKSLTESVNTRA